MYGRSHDYTPFISYGLFNRDSEEKNLLMCCYSGQGLKNDARSVVDDTHDVNVDVDSDTGIQNSIVCIFFYLIFFVRNGVFKKSR